jgi:hypothetical protein
MNRSLESRGANGVDPERSSRESREPDDAQGEWRRHAQEREHAEEYRYGYARQQERPWGGFIGDHDRFPERERYRQQPERPRYWADDDRDRFERLHRLPVPSPLPPPDLWRGRNEDYDFWGRERHPLRAEEHPSLWQRVKGAFTGKGPKNYVRSDERIREDVCEHLSYHPYIDASDIEVMVREGEVTLTGSVDGRMVKRAAEECCDHVRGVKDVHNHLRVRPQGEPTP